MKMMKIETVGSDVITADTGFIINVDVDNLEINIGASGTTTTLVGPFGTVTFTVDGATTAEKLVNCRKVGDYLAVSVQQVCSRASSKVFNLIPSIADFHSASGIVHTGGTVNTALVTCALS